MTLIITILFLCYVVVFFLAYLYKDNSLVDVFWGSGFVLIAQIHFFQSSFSVIDILICTLITLWGVRLTSHIALKKYRHSWEDARYAQWRKTWKYFYIRSFFQIYMFQWLLMLMIAYPLYASFYFSANIYVPLVIIGAVFAIFWLSYESLADYQLQKFMKIKTKGEILTTWLRRFHRYPQYFWESMFWFGICILAANYSLSVFVSWGVITFLLCFVSGIPLLEKRYAGHEAFLKYAQWTPKFFPDFRKIFNTPSR